MDATGRRRSHSPLWPRSCHARAIATFPTMEGMFLFLQLLVFLSFNITACLFSTSLGVVDPDGTLLAGIFTGPAPRNASSPSWDTAIEDMSSLMERLRREEDVSFLRGETHHRRGNYTLVSSGITHGNGRKVRHSVPTFRTTLQMANIYYYL